MNSLADTYFYALEQFSTLKKKFIFKLEYLDISFKFVNYNDDYILFIINNSEIDYFIKETIINDNYLDSVLIVKSCCILEHNIYINFVKLDTFNQEVMHDLYKSGYFDLIDKLYLAKKLENELPIKATKTKSIKI